MPQGGRGPGRLRSRDWRRGTCREPGAVSGFGWFGSGLGLAAGQGPGWSQGRCPGGKAQVIEDGPDRLRCLNGREHGIPTTGKFEFETSLPRPLARLPHQRA